MNECKVQLLSKAALLLVLRTFTLSDPCLAWRDAWSPYLRVPSHRPLQVVQHGGCLGLGLAAMTTATDALYMQMRDILFQASDGVW